MKCISLITFLASRSWVRTRLVLEIFSCFPASRSWVRSSPSEYFFLQYACRGKYPGRLVLYLLFSVWISSFFFFLHSFGSFFDKITQTQTVQMYTMYFMPSEFSSGSSRTYSSTLLSKISITTIQNVTNFNRFSTIYGTCLLYYNIFTLFIYNRCWKRLPFWYSPAAIASCWQLQVAFWSERSVENWKFHLTSSVKQRNINQEFQCSS